MKKHKKYYKLHSINRKPETDYKKGAEASPNYRLSKGEWRMPIITLTVLLHANVAI